MTNLEIFYNREDRWEFPTEHYYNEDIEMDPYYVTMKLPEYEKEEFILMLPYTPKNRQNMIGWIGVRNTANIMAKSSFTVFQSKKMSMVRSKSRTGSIRIVLFLRS